MTKPTLEQKIEANRLAPVPPGVKSPRAVRWMDAHGRSSMVMVPNGMQVADNLKAFYWAERETYSGLITAVEKAGATLGYFVVVNDDKQIIAAGRVEPDDDAQDIAWLSCVFMEMMNGTLGFLTPEEMDRSNIKNAVHCFIPLVGGAL